VKRILRWTGCTLMVIGVFGLFSPPRIIAQIFDISNNACINVPIGSATRVPACNAPAAPCAPSASWCFFGLTWVAGTTDGQFVENPYERCAASLEPEWCEVDWTNTQCLTWKVYGAAGCVGFLCDDYTTQDDCHTTSSPFFP
jgi:hypothetical protein